MDLRVGHTTRTPVAPPEGGSGRSGSTLMVNTTIARGQTRNHGHPWVTRLAADVGLQSPSFNFKVKRPCQWTSGTRRAALKSKKVEDPVAGELTTFFRVGMLGRKLRLLNLISSKEHRASSALPSPQEMHSESITCLQPEGHSLVTTLGLRTEVFFSTTCIASGGEAGRGIHDITGRHTFH